MNSEKPWPPSIEDLIDRIGLTQEAMQLDQVPLLERVKVLALLKQAQALERIAAALEDWHRSDEIRLHNPTRLASKRK